MAAPSIKETVRDMARELIGSERSLGRLWAGRSRWQIWLRWSVPPAVGVAVLAAQRLGFELQWRPLLATAAGVLAYNIVFAAALRLLPAGGERRRRLERRYEALQVALDYAAMLVLVHFTGGVASPLLFFFVFHVIFAAVLFRRRIAYAFAAAASIGMSALALAEHGGWLEPHPLRFHGAEGSPAEWPGQAAAVLLFFAASVFITAVATTTIMRRLRDRVASLAAATDEIDRLVQQRARFMLEVAHNLRAPLGAAVGMLEAIAGGYLGEVSDEQQEYLRRAERRLRAMSETVGELLALARAQRRARDREHVPVDLRAVAEELERTFAETAARKGLRLSVDAGDLPCVGGDPEMLRQMLENLLSNAIKYTPPGGRVSATLRAAGHGGVLIEVRDSGIGIPRSEQPRLFTEFFRASNARRFEEAGTGLGLALVREAVERHGGRIEVQSEEGEGTAFAVELPSGGVPPPGGPVAPSRA